MGPGGLSGASAACGAGGSASTGSRGAAGLQNQKWCPLLPLPCLGSPLSTEHTRGHQEADAGGPGPRGRGWSGGSLASFLLWRRLSLWSQPLSYESEL